jgi:hypothetical protein
MNATTTKTKADRFIDELADFDGDPVVSTIKFALHRPESEEQFMLVVAIVAIDKGRFEAVGFKPSGTGEGFPLSGTIKPTEDECKASALLRVKAMGRVIAQSEWTAK